MSLMFFSGLECISDIRDAVRKGRVDDETKIFLIKNRIPEKTFKFPPKVYTDKRKGGGAMRRYCQQEWFQIHNFLTYSRSVDGVYCLCCVLFPMPAHQGSKARNLISSPYQNWKDAKKDLETHASLQYHKDSMAKMNAFVHTYENPSQRVDHHLTTNRDEAIALNRKVLTSILECIEHCGRQGQALRSHRDDGLPSVNDDNNPGNFKATLLLLSGKDEVLRTHLETCSKNASYTSKTAQNDLLDCIKSFIQDRIVSEIKEQETGPFYGLVADEVTDSANWEQLAIMVRYTRNGKPVERLLEYVQCESITGVAIADKLLETVKSANLDPKYCRSQTYDGAGNMAGAVKGAAKMFEEKAQNPRAPYFHCASHDLNLALSKSCKVPEVKNMICAMISLGIYFKYSPKRQRALERSIESHNDLDETAKPILKSKVKPLCETRWIERHTSFTQLQELYEPIIETLQLIAENRECIWEGKPITEASGLYAQLTSPAFLVAFQVCQYVFGFTKILATLLQGSEMDIITAYQHIEEVCREIQSVRENAETEFKPIFQAASQMAQMSGNQVSMPRNCSRQTLRSNVESSTPEEYYRRSVFVPFLDSLLLQLSSRFSKLSGLAAKALFLLPQNLDDITDTCIADIVEFYEKDLPSAQTVKQELRFWKGHWATEKGKPGTVSETLCHPSCSMRRFPNICTILHVLLVTAVTSAGVERSNSSLRFVKNVYRSTMGEDRLNALLLVFVHRDILLDYNKVIDLYASRHPRRMLFINPLSSK